ncbi:MAG: arsenical pump-driving ATPase [Rhodobacteraceae bacterium]|nr:arsenical pump-driving ATPase [Paracoccaceae bacterium]
MFKTLPKFAFFTGKGGVGKTSLACATALNLADGGQKILLVSTDPASNVGQVFETEIGNKITAITKVPGLDAIEINPEEAAADYRERIVGPMRGILPEDALRSIEEQLSGACTIEIAAFDEFTALLTDNDLVDRYDHVIFDTAPTGHTIRMLKLPGAWSGFLEEGKGDASCLGPLVGLQKQRDRYAAAVDRLSDAATTRLILVARPRHSALAEVARTSIELAAIGIRNQQLAINGMMPTETSGDPLAAALLQRDLDALAGMTPEIAALPRASFALRSENLVGIDALKRFAAGDAQSVDIPQAAPIERSGHPRLGTLVNQLETAGKGLIMFMGKGGVGKTTMAAAVASELAARGHDVLLTTTDPAAHITETLAGTQNGLSVSRIDPEVETAKYHAQIMATKGRDLDAQARAMLEEDLRSPCTEEIAVFQAFSKVIRASSKQFVIMDTAPTGHTLLLLDATGSYHKDILRHADQTQQARMVTPMMRLQDPQQTKILITTLPETTPVLEASRLQDDLRRAGIEPWGWIINSSLAAAETSQPLLQKRALSEQKQIAEVGRLSKRYAVVPMQAVEPVGVERLRELCEVEQNHLAA